jgi:hypothetical protein
MLYAASSAINPPDGQFGQIHAHLTDGIAIKIDGSLKHGTGQGMTNAIKDCLKNWGWRL